MAFFEELMGIFSYNETIGHQEKLALIGQIAGQIIYQIGTQEAEEILKLNVELGKRAMASAGGKDN